MLVWSETITNVSTYAWFPALHNATQAVAWLSCIGKNVAWKLRSAPKSSAAVIDCMHRPITALHACGKIGTRFSHVFVHDFQATVCKNEPMACISWFLSATLNPTPSLMICSSWYRGKWCTIEISGEGRSKKVLETVYNVLNRSTELHLFTMQQAHLLEIRKLQLTVRKTWFIKVLIFVSTVL